MSMIADTGKHVSNMMTAAELECLKWLRKRPNSFMMTKMIANE